MGFPLDSPTREKPLCKNCKNRHEACWGKCEKYKEWRNLVDTTNKARKEYQFKAAIFSKIT